ncbi:MAG TPA: hypothetical protein VK184_10030 [Nostocaceae cyanobacterium]|nr:hypothetical protein [Nostocaceae cyanobacterium]
MGVSPSLWGVLCDRYGGRCAIAYGGRFAIAIKRVLCDRSTQSTSYD